jgi:hypothetical protein
MEQQRLEKTAQQHDQETEEIQHGPLPVEQLQVNGFLYIHLFSS